MYSFFLLFLFRLPALDDEHVAISRRIHLSYVHTDCLTHAHIHLSQVSHYHLSIFLAAFFRFFLPFIIAAKSVSDTLAARHTNASDYRANALTDIRLGLGLGLGSDSAR